MGGGEHSDNGFILAGPRRERVVQGGKGFSADGIGTFASFYRGPEATELPGFNFCDGAPLTGDERLELCYFPAIGGDRSVEGRGDSDSASPCVEGDFARDPHLSFPFGGRADLRGRDGQYYCFLSAPRLAINIKTEDATFRLHNLYDEGGTLVVDGSFLTEVHFVARVGGRKNKLCLASFWASELNEYNTGFNMITGKCGGGDFFLGIGASKRCEEMLIAVRFSSAEFTIGDWTVVVRGNWVYERISGPAHRLDISLRARGGVAARHLPHGIIGQAFASAEPRHGRVDEYPASGTFRTSAMAEGAIDGNAAMYELAGPHATAFAFSRFEAAEATEEQPGLLAADGEAASTDGAVEASHLSMGGLREGWIEKHSNKEEATGGTGGGCSDVGVF
ncbi:hypothetical protein EMIHUDRAFT_240589 [Emiliania huxleyi CCMP1516]|uniref:LamG domain-containing protein n=2 Tax=Emiliania huxleyi TaxID=2903 RepID=A0A0D3JEY3_EMIH1|nr:hypothetical protein EMIHUDRAFT_240589 [Emiliania huxleyi CCMP1516]EOD22068.1 hypothetical protein EMIHUDRAFT_240589 [Emiliania huxleyi CCMP1516]|eukprot:XP_005774497.1 hypothetical protein EMIHUDRAFT_240589 [Emiliania huxleyi CCMP1516]